MLPRVEKLTRRPAATPGRRAFTLVEVLIAAIVMAMVCGGILATIIQSRRLTEGSIVQNSVNAILQGYIEQTKSIDYGSIPFSPAAAYDLTNDDVAASYQIATMPDALQVSYGTAPTSANYYTDPSTTPPGAVDNLPTIRIKTPAVNPNDTIYLNVWVWVKNRDGEQTNVTSTMSITMIYTYKFQDGGRLRTIRGSLRTMRSVVPSF
ncbi:MAG: prepilin-type N-terminal cleavage/methylation domain-containing protein [Verrucomicrobia bacterium]|nr:prepilin-type N-terminal cleavage/methylation domain-containing protein [Verrucomicrobiota bacterium]